MYFLEMRKKSLNDNEVSLLKVRISLSRIIRIFKIDELANEWKINRVTLYTILLNIENHKRLFQRKLN
jgi:hypothetical protein